MVGYIGAMWRCRYFWLSLVKIDLRTRYRRSVIGLGWSLLRPISMTIILCAVFRRIFNIPANYCSAMREFPSAYLHCIRHVSYIDVFMLF